MLDGFGVLIVGWGEWRLVGWWLVVGGKSVGFWGAFYHFMS